MEADEVARVAAKKEASVCFLKLTLTLPTLKKNLNDKK